MTYEALKQLIEVFGGGDWHDEIVDSEWADKANKAIAVGRQAIAEAEKQEPVAIKFKIYKPTVPDPLRQGINNALLPWVYDQDRSSGFDASMWVTPVATLPPQRQPLTDDEIWKDERIMAANCGYGADFDTLRELIRAVEAAHGIKEKSGC